MPQLRMEARDPEPDQCFFHTIKLALFAKWAFAVPARSLGIFFPKARNCSHGPVITPGPQPAHKSSLQVLGVEPIRPGPSKLAARLIEFAQSTVTQRKIKGII